MTKLDPVFTFTFKTSKYVYKKSTGLLVNGCKGFIDIETFSLNRNQENFDPKILLSFSKNELFYKWNQSEFERFLSEY